MPSKKTSSKLWKVAGWVLLFLIILVPRLWQLALLPGFLTHDEIVYAAQARSFAVQGTTLDGTIYPWSFTPIHPYYAELPSVLLAPFFAFFSHPLLAMHVPSALLGSLFPFVFAWFVWEIWKDKKLAGSALFVVACNPLWFQLSRITYDATLSVFFYVLASAVFLHFHGWKKLWCVLIFLIGFYQYQGMKLLMLPWVGFTLLLQMCQQNIKLKSRSWQAQLRHFFSKEQTTIATCVILTLVFAAYLFVFLPQQGKVTERLSLFIWNDTSKVARLTDETRRLSLTSPLTTLVANKWVTLENSMVQRVIETLSPNRLFLFGEPTSSGFLVTTHGFFYVLDMVLLLLGIAAIARRSHGFMQLGVLAIFTVLFSLLNMINGQSEWYTFRSLLVYIVLLIVATHGLAQVLSTRWRYPFLLFYLLGVFLFGWQYFLRMPVTASDQGTFAESLLASYIHRVRVLNPEQKVVVHTIDPIILLESYLVHDQQITKENAEIIRHTLLSAEKDTYIYKNLTFTTMCVPTQNEGIVHIADTTRGDCSAEGEVYQGKQQPLHPFPSAQKESRIIKFVSLRDSGELYRIVGDTICQGDHGESYLRISTLDQFDLEKLTTPGFCSTWTVVQK